jgi:hypothetical protein
LETGYVSRLKTFRRGAYAQTAGYDPTLLYVEDRDLVYKVEEVTALDFLDRPLCHYVLITFSLRLCYGCILDYTAKV